MSEQNKVVLFFVAFFLAMFVFAMAGFWIEDFCDHLARRRKR